MEKLEIVESACRGEEVSILEIVSCCARFEGLWERIPRLAL
jgi:hypothetical protein